MARDLAAVAFLFPLSLSQVSILNSVILMQRPSLAFKAEDPGISQVFRFLTSRTRKQSASNARTSPGTMCEIDERLKQLAIEAQRHPPKSLSRQQALADLLMAIRQSGKLAYPCQGQFQGFYDEIYEEARQRLFVFICEHIDRYDPDKEVLQWANFLLKQRFFIEASREILPLLSDGNKSAQIKRRTLMDLERTHVTETEAQPSLFEEIEQCLQEDPEGVFRAAYVANQPKANFQFLAIRRISGYTWKEISTEVNVNVANLSKFYERSLAKFAPTIRRYLSQ